MNELEAGKLLAPLLTKLVTPLGIIGLFIVLCYAVATKIIAPIFLDYVRARKEEKNPSNFKPDSEDLYIALKALTENVSALTKIMTEHHQQEALNNQALLLRMENLKETVARRDGT